MVEPAKNEKVKPTKRSRALPIIALITFGFVLFVIGWGIGSHKLSFYNDGPTTQNKDIPEDLNYSSVEDLYDLLRRSYDGDLDAKKLLDGLKTGLVEAAGDPYTEYLDPEAAMLFKEQLSGSFTGIGAELGTDDDKNIIIISPLNGFPAQKAGLKAQDIIAAIEGETTIGMSISEAVRKIRGPEGTDVKLTIVRDNEPLEVTIKRAKITIPSVEWRIKDGIGYLKINQFSTDTPHLVKKAAQEFLDNDVKGVIIDLRGNPGGFLNTAVDVSSLWLDKGSIVVAEKQGGEVVKTDKASGTNILKGLPTVVLIDQGSASASEIVAGALKDHKAATLVGMKSFGKGSVQRVEELAGGGELKVTIARWYTPAGKNIDKEGIEPDIKIENSQNDASSGKDSLLDKAYEILK